MDGFLLNLASVKKVVSIIRPFKLDELKDRLSEMGLSGITVGEVKFDEEGPLRELGFSGGFIPRLKVEVVVTDDMAEDVLDLFVDVLKEGATTEYVYVVDVVDVVRIRTGDRGEEAL